MIKQVRGTKIIILGQFASALQQFKTDIEELEADWDAADRRLQKGLSATAKKYTTKQEAPAAAKTEIDAKITRGE